METFSLTRDLTLILKNTRQEFCRIWGRNALGKLSGVTLSTSERNDLNPANGAGESSSASLALPVEVEDIEVLTLPDPETYFPIGEMDDAREKSPLGAMFCDVYRREGRRFEKLQTASDITDSADLYGGVTGAGVEFFYPPGTDEYRETKWDLSVPMFRDPLTPTLPEGTLNSLFDYGETDDSRSKPASGSSVQPTLRSAI